MDASRPQEQKQTSPIESLQGAPPTDMSNNPARTIPENPDTRKVFIQEVRTLPLQPHDCI